MLKHRRDYLRGQLIISRRRAKRVVRMKSRRHGCRSQVLTPLMQIKDKGNRRRKNSAAWSSDSRHSMRRRGPRTTCTRHTLHTLRARIRSREQVDRPSQVGRLTHPLVYCVTSSVQNFDRSLGEERVIFNKVRFQKLSDKIATRDMENIKIDS